MCWKEEKVLQIEPNTTYSKYKQSAHISLVAQPIRQPSMGHLSRLDSHRRTEVRKLQFRPV
jgi:hypothetical protein